MAELLTLLLKIALVGFMAGNLLDLGLRLDRGDALRGLRDPRYVALTVIWGFVLCPALALAISLLVPLEPPYAVGLILLGMTPCAPFLPVLAAKGKGDVGYTAALMLLAAVGTVVFMPIAVPVLVTRMTVSPWMIAKPLLVMMLIPLAVGIAIRRASFSMAARILPHVRKVTGIATLALALLVVVIYGKGMLGVAGSLAVASQVMFFLPVVLLTYWLGFGMPHEQRIVLTTGMSTRNLGAAIAPLLAVTDVDPRASIMIVLALPITFAFALLATKLFRAPVTE